MTNRTLQKSMFQTATALLGLAVLLGAFGAHQLKSVLQSSDLDTYNTAVQYQFIHAMALLILSMSLRRLKEKNIKIVFRLLLIGMGLFCGSLYLLATRPALGFNGNFQWIGAITPIGGLCFITAWFYLAYDGFKASDNGAPLAVAKTSTSEKQH